MKRCIVCHLENDNDNVRCFNCRTVFGAVTWYYTRLNTGNVAIDGLTFSYKIGRNGSCFALVMSGLTDAYDVITNMSRNNNRAGASISTVRGQLELVGLTDTQIERSSPRYDEI